MTNHFKGMKLNEAINLLKQINQVQKAYQFGLLDEPTFSQEEIKEIIKEFKWRYKSAITRKKRANKK